MPLICPSCGARQEADTEVCFSCGRLISALTQGHVLAARYEILSLLGRGGMGVVYKAQDRLLDEPVAIKVLRSDLMGTPELARRFRSEIKLARKVSHNNVCRIHEYGEDGPLSYISMALIEGTDLRRILRKHPDGMPPDDAFEAAIQASDGLQAIHQVGIIHRDLKTPNIVRDASGVVRLMDFGIAKEADRNAGFTATGEVMGTPEYMSPEQCRGQRLDFRSDVYSMGIVIYEMFTGHVPFHGETVMATLLQQLQEPPPLEGTAAARLPSALVPVLRRALAKEPGDRYPSAAHLAVALRAARDGAAAASPSAALDAEAGDPPPTVSLADAPAVATPAPESGAERRRDSRLAISVDLVLVRIGPDGLPGPDERTLADNIGRRGARILTADERAAIGDVVRLAERGGDFQTSATVRHVSVGADGIRRLGVEFIERTAPDRLLPNPEARPRPRRQSRPVASQLPETPIALKSVRHDGPERRRTSRLGISFDLLLRRLSPSGTTLAEERTIADNVGRHGVRVMTTMSGLEVGEVVSIEEIGGPFRTRATVRNTVFGPDRIRRVGLEFLDREAPASLVPSDPAARRSSPPTPITPATPVTPITPTSPVTPVTPTAPVRASSPVTPVPSPITPAPLAAPPKAPAAPVTREEVLEVLERANSRSHFEVLGVSQVANDAEIKEAVGRMTRRFHPDVPLGPDVADLKRQVEAIFIRVNEAYDVLRDRTRRERHERMLGMSPSSSRVHPKEEPARAAASPAPPRSGPRPPDPEADAELAESVLKEARVLLARERHWDAIQKLEGAIGLAPGSKINQSLRVLLAQTIAKNPKWQKRAEEILLSVINENAKLAEAHLELGTLYKRAGLKARAAAQFRMVLQLRPADAQAAAELAALA